MKKAINVRTQEQWDKVMEVFEKKSWKWDGGELPTKVNFLGVYKEDTCILYNNNILFCGLDYYKEEGYEILSFEEFLKEEGIEEKPKYRKVYVSDESVEDALEMEDESILLIELPGKAIYKYVCVSKGYEKDFNNGDEYETTCWSYIAEIPDEKEQETITIGESTYDKAEFEKAVANLKPLK